MILLEIITCDVGPAIVLPPLHEYIYALVDVLVVPQGKMFWIFALPVYLLQYNGSFIVFMIRFISWFQSLQILARTNHFRSLLARFGCKHFLSRAFNNGSVATECRGYIPSPERSEGSAPVQFRTWVQVQLPENRPSGDGFIEQSSTPSTNLLLP